MKNNVKPIRTKRDYELALKELERLWGAKSGTPEGDRLDVLATLIDAYEAANRPPFLERIPVRHREEVRIVPVGQIASIVAEGELLKITTVRNEHHTITYRLKDLEGRLDPARFVRLGRGTIANMDLITKVTIMPGGTHIAMLSNGQKLQVSRLQSRVLRERLLKL